jgi:hypothetical protein
VGEEHSLTKDWEVTSLVSFLVIRFFFRGRVIDLGPVGFDSANLEPQQLCFFTLGCHLMFTFVRMVVFDGVLGLFTTQQCLLTFGCHLATTLFKVFGFGGLTGGDSNFKETALGSLVTVSGSVFN